MASTARRIGKSPLVGSIRAVRAKVCPRRDFAPRSLREHIILFSCRGYGNCAGVAVTGQLVGPGKTDHRMGSVPSCVEPLPWGRIGFGVHAIVIEDKGLATGLRAAVRSTALEHDCDTTG